MPIYEYRCESCETRFEEYLSTSDKPVPPCPQCGAAGAARVYSAFATEWLPGDVNWHRVGSSWDR
jgi:putative FmdB family regulatory protein